MKKTAFLIGLMVALLVGIVYGTPAVTLIYPSASYFGGIIKLNATIADYSGDGTNVTNVTWEYKLSTASTYTSACTNTSGNLSTGATAGWTCDWDTRSLVDISQYNFRAYYQNDSGDIIATSTATSAIYPDNTVPICSQSTLENDKTYDPDTTTTVTVTSTNSSACWVYFDKNYYSISDVCTFTLGDVPDQLYSEVIFSTSDSRNDTACTTVKNVNIKSPRPRGMVYSKMLEYEDIDGAGEEIRELAAIQGIKPKSSNYGGILLVIIIGVVIYLLFFADKK